MVEAYNNYYNNNYYYYYFYYYSLVKSAQQAVTRERSKELEDRTERIKEMAPCKSKRALDLAAEKGSSAWLTFLPLQDLGFNLNKRQFRDAVKLRYDWPNNNYSMSPSWI